MNKKTTELIQKLKTDHGFTPVMACEVEWYLIPTQTPDNEDVFAEDFIRRVKAHAEEKKLALHSVDRERGHLQMEAALHPEKNISTLIENYKKLVTIIEQSASEMNGKADFSAKPKPEDYGSAIHVHVHLEDENGNSVFAKNDEGLIAPLRYSIGGLIVTMEEQMGIFLPTDDSWRRIEKGFHAPVNVSWGFNNRTTAIRLPDGVGQYAGAEAIAAAKPGKYKRIEHRVAGSDADFEQLINAIVYGIEKGLAEMIEPPAPIHGDASDGQYELKSFKAKA